MDLPKNNQRLNEQDELRRLREENARLKVLLTRHGIAREEPAVSEPVPAPAPTLFTTDGKIALFRRLFRGREDVYPQRWESAKGTSGYDPLAPWRELTGYHGDINPRKPSAMRDLWCAIIERAGSFDRTVDRTQFMFKAAGPVIDALVEAHRDEYAEEDGSLDPHTIRLDVMGRLSTIFGTSATAAALGQWFEDRSEHFEKPSTDKISQGISHTAVGAVVSS